MSENIGFIGLGNMGLPIATNLLSAGFGLRVYNRTAAKARPLIDKGAIHSSTPAGVASPGGVVVSIVSDDRALEEISTEPFIAALSPGGVHLSLSTVSPVTSKRLAELHARQGVAFVSAPVFGRPEAAAAAKLYICVSGAADAKQRATPIFDAIGQKTFDFGDEVGAANVVKLAGNFLITAAQEAMAEAAAMAEKNGIPRAALLNMFNSTLFNCPIYNSYGKRMIAADFDKVGFSVPLILKDMILVRQIATDSRAPMPIANLLCDRYLTAIAKGRGHLDATAMALGAAEDAGLSW